MHRQARHVADLLRSIISSETFCMMWTNRLEITCDALYTWLELFLVLWRGTIRNATTY